MMPNLCFCAAARNQAYEALFQPKPQQILREQEYLRAHGKVVAAPVARSGIASVGNDAKISSGRAVVPTQAVMPQEYPV